MPLSLNDLAGVVKLAWKIQTVGSSKYTSARMSRSFVPSYTILTA